MKALWPSLPTVLAELVLMLLSRDEIRRSPVPVPGAMGPRARGARRLVAEADAPLLSLKVLFYILLTQKIKLSAIFPAKMSLFRNSRELNSEPGAPTKPQANLRPKEKRLF